MISRGQKLVHCFSEKGNVLPRFHGEREHDRVVRSSRITEAHPRRRRINIAAGNPDVQVTEMDGHVERRRWSAIGFQTGFKLA